MLPLQVFPRARNVGLDLLPLFPTDPVSTHAGYLSQRAGVGRVAGSSPSIDGRPEYGGMQGGTPPPGRGANSPAFLRVKQLIKLIF